MISYLSLAVPLTRLLRHMGGVGLIVIGVVGSFVPLPGGIEALTIWLAARHRDWWWYYGLTATLGSVVGGYIPYQMGWSGGQQFLAKRMSARQAENWARRLHSWGFGAVVLSGLVPPPLPSMPVLVAAGAVRYPRQRFIAALTLGRALRFYALALLAYVYRRRAVRFMSHALVPMIAVTVLLAIAYGGWLWYQKRDSEPEPLSEVPALADDSAHGQISEPAKSLDSSTRRFSGLNQEL